MRGKERLAASGYYIEYYGPKSNNIPREYAAFYIGDDKRCEHIDFRDIENGVYDWSILNWFSAPTKKEVEQNIPDHAFDNRFIHYECFEDFSESTGIHVEPNGFSE